MSTSQPAQAADPAYVMYVGNMSNGIIFPAFNNAEIYPGQPVKVRGEDGLNYEHGAALVARGDFIWCNDKGTPIPIGEEPQPTPAEAAVLNLSGAAMPQGGNVAYPEYHRTDPAYTGPSEAEEAGTPPEQPEIIEVHVEGQRTLSIGGVPNGRADEAYSGVTPETGPDALVTEQDSPTDPANQNK